MNTPGISPMPVGTLKGRSFQAQALDSTTTHLEGDPAGHQTDILALLSENAFPTSATLSMLVKGRN
jgi:hypothetical protein